MGENTFKLAHAHGWQLVVVDSPELSHSPGLGASVLILLSLSTDCLGFLTAWLLGFKSYHSKSIRHFSDLASEDAVLLLLEVVMKAHLGSRVGDMDSTS